MIKEFDIVTKTEYNSKLHSLARGRKSASVSQIFPFAMEIIAREVLVTSFKEDIVDVVKWAIEEDLAEEFYN